MSSQQIYEMLKDNAFTDKQLEALNALADAFAETAELKNLYLTIKNRAIRLDEVVKEFIKLEPPTT